MRFSGRKGDLEGVFVGSRSGRKGQRRGGKYYLPVKEERGKWNKTEENCRKYATEMKNEKAQMRGGEKRADGRERGADDSIVLKKKKEATQGERKKNRAKIAGEGEAAFQIRQAWRIQKGKCRMKGEGGGTAANMRQK